MSIKNTPTGMHLLLSCGHWSNEMHPASSILDFPGEPIYCEECDDDRQLNINLQAFLYQSK